MRIGIFVVMAGRKAGGPETYEVELIRALAKLDRRTEYFVYCTGREAVSAIGVQQENFVYRVLQPPVRALSIAFSLPALLVKDGVRFYHSTFTPPPFSPTKFVFTMHCMTSMVHPDSYRPAAARRLNFLLKKGVTKADCIACVSETTLNHVHQFFGIPRERMLVTYNGVSPQFAPIPPGEARHNVAEALGVRDPFLLYVGKLQAHKNIPRLVRAYHAFRLETGSQAKLLLAGRRAGSFSGLEETIRELGLQQQVVELGYLPDEILPSLYSAARMFVFPSLWEGFGIPLVEAMACGTPVLTSSAACLPEIAGDAAVIVDPASVEQIAEGMARLDTSAELREKLIAAGLERARKFTWENCARATLQAYARLGYSSNRLSGQ